MNDAGQDPATISVAPSAAAVTGDGRTPQRPSAVLAGALWMLSGAVCFTTMNAIMKHLGDTLPTGMIVVFRMVIGLAVVLPVAIAVAGPSIVKTAAPVKQAVRSFFGAASLACMVYAVHALPFATATALTFTTPLWIVLLSFAFLGDRPTRRSLVAAAVGFLGVLVIARPTVTVDIAVLVALAGALSGAVALTMVRALSARDRTLTLVIYFSLYGSLYSLPTGILYWTEPTATELMLLVSTGVIGVMGLFCSAQAYRVANAAVVAPVDFVRLPLAALIGIAIFSEFPDLYTGAGTLLILGSLLLIVTERRR